jgi:hypothetical protein
MEVLTYLHAPLRLRAIVARIAPFGGFFFETTSRACSPLKQNMYKNGVKHSNAGDSSNQGDEDMMIGA